MAHAAEWGHWYDRQGRPVYEMPYADGRPGTRPVTLRDARKLGLVPGVSGVMNCAAKPGLELWKAKQVLLSALTLPRLKDETEDDYLDRIMVDSRETAKKAADKGTAIHAALQNFYEGKPWSEFQQHIQAATKKLDEHFGSQRWEAEASFACPLGFGGKKDLRCAPAIVDAKTKEFTTADLENDKQLAWDEHVCQLSAYRVGSNRPSSRCANLFISTTEPGLVYLHEWKEDELQRGWRMFVALLQFWQAKNRYVSSWTPEPTVTIAAARMVA